MGQLLELGLVDRLPQCVGPPAHVFERRNALPVHHGGDVLLMPAALLAKVACVNPALVMAAAKYSPKGIGDHRRKLRSLSTSSASCGGA